MLKKLPGFISWTRSYYDNQKFAFPPWGLARFTSIPNATTALKSLGSKTTTLSTPAGTTYVFGTYYDETPTQGIWLRGLPAFVKEAQVRAAVAELPGFDGLEMRIIAKNKERFPYIKFATLKDSQSAYAFFESQTSFLGSLMFRAKYGTAWDYTSWIEWQKPSKKKNKE